MKKVITYVFLIFIVNFIFAENTVIDINNKSIGVRYKDNSSDLIIYSTQGKELGAYLIESVGPDCRVLSMFSDIVNNTEILFVEVYLGNPGGRQSLDLRNLYIFKIDNKGKFKLILEKEIVNIHYSVSAKDFTSFKFYFYTYNPNNKILSIFDSKYYEITEIEKIDIKQLIKQ